MGKTVTYAIKYKKTDELEKGLKHYLHQYNLNSNSNNLLKGAESILELIEWLTLDSEDLIDESEYQFKNTLKIAIQKCLNIISVILDSKELLQRAYKGLSQAYLLLEEYGLALEFGQKELDLILTDPVKYYLQNAYRNMGCIYFTKSLDKIKSRYSDYENAIRYYKLERDIIKTMTLNDILEDPEEDDINRLLQSCYFNIGVMQSKTSSQYHDGEANLRRAISLARQLKDYASEKTAWWELGNLFKKMGQHELVKECQKEEFILIQKYNFSVDNYYCYEERMKYHLFLGEYEAFQSIFAESVQNQDPPSKPYRDTYEFVTSLKSIKEKLNESILREDLNISIASDFVDYIEILREHDLHRLVIKDVDTSFHSLLNARDVTPMMYSILLLYKTQSLWYLRESNKEDYFKANNEAFDYAEANLVANSLSQLQIMIDILKLRVRFHEYFEQSFQMESCKQLLADTIREEKVMRQNLSKKYKSDTVSSEHTRITPAVYKGIKRRIKVKILLDPEPIQFNIQYDFTPETAEKLMNDISARCWINYGIEPELSHLRTLDHDLRPEDYIINVLKEDNQDVEAFVKCIKRKPPLQTYLNACDRLDIKPIKNVELALSKQTLTNISFIGLNMTNEQIKPLQQVIKHSISLQYLSLASNSLKNEQLKEILQDINNRLGELDLSNNNLTSDCIHIVNNILLTSINLSNNPIEADIFTQLPTFLDNVPSLKQLSLKNTNIGELNTMLSQPSISKMSQGANLCLDISNNHFESKMLERVTLFITQIKRIYKIELSSITSAEDWANFDLLSDLSKLSDLSLKYSIKDTFKLCHFKEFFSLKSRLTHIDFTSCNLSNEDIAALSYALDFVVKLRKLTLNSNPKIGDEGLQYLNTIVEKSKIDILDLSNCGITCQSQDLINKWKYYLRQLDITENTDLKDIVIMSNNNQQSAMIKLNHFNRHEHLTSTSIQPISGLSFQHTSDLPTSPFE